MYLLGLIALGLVGADGETHQGVFDIAFLRHLPNLVIMMPKDENEGQHMVHTALTYEEGPIAMRYPRGNGLGVEMDSRTEKHSDWYMGSIKRRFRYHHFNVWYDDFNGDGCSSRT